MDLFGDYNADISKVLQKPHMKLGLSAIVCFRSMLKSVKDRHRNIQTDQSQKYHFLD